MEISNWVYLRGEEPKTEWRRKDKTEEDGLADEESR